MCFKIVYIFIALSFVLRSPAETPSHLHQTINVKCYMFFLHPSLQLPGSSGTTQSMKKTMGHRGVETTTGETTYKKVRTG